MKNRRDPFGAERKFFGAETDLRRGIFTSVSTNRSQETLQEEDLVTAELILADSRHAIVRHWGGGAGWFIILLIL